MTSDKQIQANRKNAKKSTGPKTALGRSISSKNAITHGFRSRQVVIKGESRSEYNDFRQMLIEHYTPADPVEAAFVDRICVCLWRLRRSETIEAQVFDNLREETEAAKRKETPDPLLLEMPDGNDSQKNIRLEICLIIKQIFQLYLEHKHNPRIASAFEQIEASIKYYTENPNTYYVPAERVWLEFVRAEFTGTEYLSEQDVAELDEGIECLRSLEKKVEEDNASNLGHAVAADINANNVLTKLTRYESQIQSNLFKAMQEFEKLQKSRKGGHTPPQQPIDVEISEQNSQP